MRFGPRFVSICLFRICYSPNRILTTTRPNNSLGNICIFASQTKRLTTELCVFNCTAPGLNFGEQFTVSYTNPVTYELFQTTAIIPIRYARRVYK